MYCWDMYNFKLICALTLIDLTNNSCYCDKICSCANRCQEHVN